MLVIILEGEGKNDKIEKHPNDRIKIGRNYKCDVASTIVMMVTFLDVLINMRCHGIHTAKSTDAKKEKHTHVKHTGKPVYYS